MSPLQVEVDTPMMKAAALRASDGCLCVCVAVVIAVMVVAVMIID